MRVAPAIDLSSAARTKLEKLMRRRTTLYLNPPEHALVWSVDEKSQIQALDRTQPGLPMKKGRGREGPHQIMVAPNAAGI